MRELPVDLFQYSLPMIDARRQRIYEQGFLPVCDLTLSPDQFTALVQRVTRLTGAKYEAVFESLRHLAGQLLTRSDAVTTAWRLSANMPTLQGGAPVRPWTTQRADEWVPVEILRASLVRTRKKELATEFDLCVLAGTPVGTRPTVLWSRNMCLMVARRIGFSRRGGIYNYQQPADLVGLRCYGHVAAERSAIRPVIREVECPPGLISWNRKNILGLRCRYKQQCPNGWTHACHQCAVGYEACAGATHYRTFVRQPCPECQQPEAIFDPESRLPTCIECTKKHVLRGE